MVGEVLRHTLVGIKFLFAFDQGLFDVLQILGRAVAGAELHGFEFEQHAHVDQRRKVILLDLQRIGDQTLQHLHLLLRHDRAALGKGLDDAVKLQLLKRRPHVGAPHPQHFGKPPLGGQAFARLQTPRIELLLDVFEYGFYLFDIR